MSGAPRRTRPFVSTGGAKRHSAASTTGDARRGRPSPLSPAGPTWSGSTTGIACRRMAGSGGKRTRSGSLGTRLIIGLGKRDPISLCRGRTRHAHSTYPIGDSATQRHTRRCLAQKRSKQRAAQYRSTHSRWDCLNHRPTLPLRKFDATPHRTLDARKRLSVGSPSGYGRPDSPTRRGRPCFRVLKSPAGAPPRGATWVQELPEHDRKKRRKARVCGPFQ